MPGPVLGTKNTDSYNFTFNLVEPRPKVGMDIQTEGNGGSITVKAQDQHEGLSLSPLASAKPALSDGHFLPRASSFRQGSLLIGWLGTRPLGTAQRPLWSLSRPLGLDPSAAGSMVLATTCGA